MEFCLGERTWNACDGVSTIRDSQSAVSLQWLTDGIDDLQPLIEIELLLIALLWLTII